MATKGDEVLSQFTQTVVEEEVEVRDEDKLRIGIIGTGWIAESHIESYKRMKDVKVVAMADLIPGKAEKFAARYGIENCKFYPDHKSMLDSEKLDAVSVCTYNTQHAPCAIYALEKGVNVLLEKPMCVTTFSTPILRANAAPSSRLFRRAWRYSTGTRPSVCGPSVKFQNLGPTQPHQKAVMVKSSSLQSALISAALSSVQLAGSQLISWP